MGVRSPPINRQEKDMIQMIGKFRVECDGPTIRVYEDGNILMSLYVGVLTSIDSEGGGTFVDRHHHGAITHSHEHEGPHLHEDQGEEDYFHLSPDVEGMDPSTFISLRLAALRHHANNPPPPLSVEVVEAALDRALFVAIGGYLRTGMTQRDAEDRVRDRLVRATDAMAQELRSFMAQMEAMADVEIDLEEIERLGREDPLEPQERASLADKVASAIESGGGDASGIREDLVASLQASGLPTHYYLSDHNDGDVLVAGPFVTRSEAAAVRRTMEENPTNDDLNLCIYEGYVVNGKVVAV